MFRTWKCFWHSHWRRILWHSLLQTNNVRLGLPQCPAVDKFMFMVGEICPHSPQRPFNVVILWRVACTRIHVEFQVKVVFAWDVPIRPRCVAPPFNFIGVNCHSQDFLIQSPVHIGGPAAVVCWWPDRSLGAFGGGRNVLHAIWPITRLKTGFRGNETNSQQKKRGAYSHCSKL